METIDTNTCNRWTFYHSILAHRSSVNMISYILANIKRLDAEEQVYPCLLVREPNGRLQSWTKIVRQS